MNLNEMVTWVDAKWEYDEWSGRTQYWAEMSAELSAELESKYRAGLDLHEMEVGVSDWYEWHFDVMLQYHYYYDYRGWLRQTTREIRRIGIFHSPDTDDPRRRKRKRHNASPETTSDA